MILTLGFSPCPNDTFIFDALVNKKIDTGGIEFEPVLEDVETLNKWAFEEKLDITKLSFPAFFKTLEKYVLLNSGAALGKGVGPLLITKNKLINEKSDLKNEKVAIPGINTTANLLLSFAHPAIKNKVPMIFSAIENAVVSGKTDLGVIIHENRFTYRQRGLFKVVDLGAIWEEKMNMPIPLGGIAIKRSVDKLKIDQIDKLIRKSLEFAKANYPALPEFVKQNAQEMKEEVMRQHIELYVNNFSVDIGDVGKQAINILFETYKKLISSDDSDQSSSELFI